MLELQREKAASTQLVLLKEQLSNIYSNITITGRRIHTHKNMLEMADFGPCPITHALKYTLTSTQTEFKANRNDQLSG